MLQTLHHGSNTQKLLNYLHAMYLNWLEVNDHDPVLSL